MLEGQQIPSPYRHFEETHSLGVFGGYLWTQGVQPDLGPQSAPVLGIRYTIQFGGPVAGEAVVGFMPSERRVFAARGVDPQDPTQVIPLELGTATMPLLYAEGGVRLNITGPRTWHGLMPYLAATGGLVANLRPGVPLEEEEEIPETERFRFGPGFAVGVGAGTEWFLNERFSLRVEARDQIWRIVIPAALTETEQQQTRWTNNFGFSIGAAIHF